jgi:hypothetical protein
MRAFVMTMIALAAAWQLFPAADTSYAEKAAESWLALVDSGKYGDSWEQAASLFKGAITKGKWEEALNGTRKPLGKLESRKLLGATYTKELPGAPDGDYVVIQYSSSFANKKSATETVTPAREKDGTWRVAGYFIK